MNDFFLFFSLFWAMGGIYNRVDNHTLPCTICKKEEENKLSEYYEIVMSTFTACILVCSLLSKNK